MAGDRREALVALPTAEVVDQLDRDGLVDLATKTAAIHARAMARLTAMTGDVAACDSYLSSEEAARLLSVSEAWVYRQATRWPFAVKLGRKVVRIERAGLLRWLAQRRRR